MATILIKPVQLSIAVPFGNQLPAFEIAFTDADNLPIQSLSAVLKVRKPNGEELEPIKASMAANVARFNLNNDYPIGQYACKIDATITGLQKPVTSHSGTFTVEDSFACAGETSLGFSIARRLPVKKVATNNNSTAYDLLDASGAQVLDWNQETITTATTAQ